MSTLKVNQINLKKLIISGKEYRPISNDTITSDTFLSDYKIIKTDYDLFENGIYTYNIDRGPEDLDILRYIIKTTNYIQEYDVTYIDDYTFSFDNTYMVLEKDMYLYADYGLNRIKEIDVDGNISTVTLYEKVNQKYNIIEPVFEPLVDGKRQSVVNIYRDTDYIYVMYDFSYSTITNSFSVTTTENFYRFELDLYSVIDETRLTVQWNDIINNDNIDITSSILVGNEYVILQNGQKLTLDETSKWLVN